MLAVRFGSLGLGQLPAVTVSCASGERAVEIPDVAHADQSFGVVDLVLARDRDRHVEQVGGVSRFQTQLVRSLARLLCARPFGGHRERAEHERPRRPRRRDDATAPSRYASVTAAESVSGNLGGGLTRSARTDTP